MPTLILTPRYTADAQALWRAATSASWRVERLTGWRVPKHLAQVRDPVLYVEALFGPTLAQQLGVTLLDPPVDWLVRLPSEYRRREIALTTLGKARTNPAQLFIKPPNDKSFAAQVYSGAELPTQYPDEMAVLVSEVVKWEAEFRCFILNRQVCTWSLYARWHELQEENDFTHTPEEASGLETFLATLLADPRVDLPSATVVDAGIIEGQGWACIEQNAAWGAGIYGCDPTQVLRVIQQASVTTGSWQQ